VCGGRYGSTYTNECWGYDRTNTTRTWSRWSQHLSEDRAYAAATYRPNGEFWITGERRRVHRCQIF
jgi:hypothetical protein